MTLYDGFQLVEGMLWWGVAGVLLTRTGETPRRRRALNAAAGAFVLFGVTDWLEMGQAGRLPAWLWGTKIACGAAILRARYEWRGWEVLRWSDREILFAAVCLAGVALAMALQVML